MGHACCHFAGFPSKSMEASSGVAESTPSSSPAAELICQECNNPGETTPVTFVDNTIDISSIIDTSSVASRCSVRLIHEIVSTFGPEKKELVRAAGFHGLLSFLPLKQINLRFSAWLMSRVDELSQSLHIGDGARIHFTKEDIGMVFGIPSSGKRISPKISKQYSGSLTTQLSAGHINVKQLRSIKAAQAIVAREHVGPMSLTEQEEFKAAFVVFVMSTLFAPCGKHDRVSDDYMHIMVQPGQINSYDWAEFVMRRLLEAVSKLKADLASNVKTPYIYGCSLFLQVLYLDSIDLGALSMEHNSFPRVRSFTYDRLRVMIAADNSFSAYCSNNTGYSYPPKLRPPAGVCYHWAASKSANGHSTNQDGMLALWEVSTSMTRIFKIPLEAAGPLFVAVLSSVDFQRQLSIALGSEALKLTSLLLHIMEPYVNGFSYQTPTNPEYPPVGLCSMWQSESCSKAHRCYHTSSCHPLSKSTSCIGETSTSTDICGSLNKRLRTSRNANAVTPQLSAGLYKESAHNVQDKNTMAMTAMARFYLSTRPENGIRCTDLNAIPTGDDSGSSIFPQHERYSHSGPLSPWDLGFTYQIDALRVAGIYKRISMVEEIDEPWIVHYCPKYIEVRTCAVKAQFTGKSEMEMELVDAVLRRFKQDDDVLYRHQGPARWRHYVESDFMVSLLAGCFDISDPVVRSHFHGRHICYDVTACKIIFFPVLLQHRWACFAWRMHDNTIVVYDPLFSFKCHSYPVSYYERVGKLLKSAMVAASDNILLGWRKDWEEASLEVFHHTGTPMHCPNSSGVLCLYFCRCFDGEHIRPPVDPAQVQDISAMLLADVSSLAGNLGTAPEPFR